MILIRRVRFVRETIGEGENPREARKNFLVLPPLSRWFEPVGGKGETPFTHCFGPMGKEWKASNSFQFYVIPLLLVLSCDCRVPFIPLIQTSWHSPVDLNGVRTEP